MCNEQTGNLPQTQNRRFCVMKKVNIVIPMAGRGQRFIEAGYTTPKPLL